MTDRLYYTDPYCRRFDAVVVRVEPGSESSRVFLDRTAFYPTSGGQPFDQGTLAGLPVTDVIDDEAGLIAHVVTGTLDPGARVVGIIDWPRRFDHMQQHTGQHVLSAAFVRASKCATVSFHLGGRTSTIDLERELRADEIVEAVELANRVIWENRAVSIRFASRDEASSLPMRKESRREGILRLVDIEDFDLSACGGTHVTRTGEIGVIAVTGSERFKGGMRVEFVCGGRTLAWSSALRETVASSIRLLSVTPDQLPAAIERLQADGRDAKRTIRSLQARVAQQEALDLVARGDDVGLARVVVEAVEQWDAAGLKTLATSVTSEPSRIAVLFSTTTPAGCVAAVSPDLPADAGAILRVLTGRFGGKGGGTRALAQGGGLHGAAPELVTAARDAIRGALGQ